MGIENIGTHFNRRYLYEIDFEDIGGTHRGVDYYIHLDLRVFAEHFHLRIWHRRNIGGHYGVRGVHHIHTSERNHPAADRVPHKPHGIAHDGGVAAWEIAECELCAAGVYKKMKHRRFK